jgi:hypothetical protein
MSKCALAIYMKTRFQRHAGIAQPSDLSMLAAARARAFSPAGAQWLRLRFLPSEAYNNPVGALTITSRF